MDKHSGLLNGGRPSKSCYRILGVDPGSQKFGWACLEVLNGMATFVEYAQVKTKGKSFAHRLCEIEETLREVIALQMPDVIAWEAPFYSFGTRNADACIQLAKAVGVTERLLPAFRFVEEGYECQPSSSRKAIGCGQANYHLLRQVIGRSHIEVRRALLKGVNLEETHDRQPKALVAADAVSAMVQARAVFLVKQEGIVRKGIEQVYTTLGNGQRS